MQQRLSDAQLLEKLVGFNSVSSNSNLPIANYIADYLEHPNIETIRCPSAGNDKTNLVVSVRGSSRSSPSQSGLLLSGHLDVVPAGEPEWRSDPFTLMETADSYIGRGATDMKGFVAIAVNLAKDLADQHLDHPLVLVLSYDEELGLLGAQHFAQTWDGRFPLPGNAIIGEPTELSVVRLHKGHLQMTVTLRGVSAHTAYPHLGRSAIEPAARVVSALAGLRKSLESERYSTSDHFPETPYVALTVSRIRGGQAINMVPDECVIDVGARILPGMDSSSIVDRVEKTIGSLPELDDCEFRVVNEAASLMAPDNSEIHQTLCGLVSQGRTEAVSYASDAGVFQRMGIDCVLFGPGSIAVAHKPNESMPKTQFARARPILERVVQQFCVNGSSN